MDERYLQHFAEEDQAAVKKILESFDNPQTGRDELGKTANQDETLILEKKYIPQLNKNDLPASKCDVLICTVGLRPAPVILTTLILKPKKLYLFHSADSRRYAETIRDDPDIQGLGLDPIQDIHLKEISLTNAPENYEALKAVVNQTQHRQIVVDVTGGVKVMGVSLAAAAFWQRLPVIYLFGQEVKGIIKPFTEKLHLLKNPYEHFGDTEFKLLKAFFDEHDYDAALKISLSLKNSVGDVAILGILDIMEEFIRLYRDWDGFAHSQAENTEDRKLATRLRVLIGKMERLNLHLARLDESKMNLEFLEKLETSWQFDRRDLADRYRLIDIFCAAERRAKAGKYDDAVARLYRCLEMSATILLMQNWTVQSLKKPDLSQLAAAVGGEATLREKFHQIAGYDLPNKALGLNDQMTLLQIGGQHQDVCGIYAKMTSSDGSLMEARNRSTLAHGTVPVSKEIYEQFRRKTEEIISRVTTKEDLRNLLRQATHPKLTLPKALH